MQHDKSNNIAEQQQQQKQKLLPIVGEHSTTPTKDYHLVQHQSSLTGGGNRGPGLVGPGPRGPGAEVITKNEEEIRGGGGRGNGGGSVAIPPANNSFRRTNEPREHEEYVIRERYFSRPPAEEDIAAAPGLPPGGGPPSGPTRLGPILKPKYPSTWTTVTHAAHLESSSGGGGGPTILRDSSAMLTPETPEEFRPRIHRNPEIRSRPLMEGGGVGDDNSNNLIYNPSSNHGPSLLRTPFSGGPGLGPGGPGLRPQVPQPHPQPPPQELRHHPFAQDSVFCHQIPTKPFRGTVTNTSLSSSDPALASAPPSGLSSISPIDSTTTFSLRGPLHSNIQNLSSIIRNTRPIEIKSHNAALDVSNPHATATSDEPARVSATDLSPPTIQHQPTWHRPIKVNTTPTLVPHLPSSPIPPRPGPGLEPGTKTRLAPIVGSGSPAGSPPSSAVPPMLMPGPAPPTHPGTSSDFPTHFRFGSLIQLSNGDLKTVESLTTQDFIQSAETSSDVRIDHSIVTSVELKMEKGTANISFSVGKQKVQVAVEATLEHPFFVVGHGWSSSSPDHTLAKYRLPCKQLRVGDVCISLTHCEKTNTISAVSASSGTHPLCNSGDIMTSTTTTSHLQPQQPDLKMMKPPPPPAESMLEQRRRSNSASPSDKILKRSYNFSSSTSGGGCPSPLALRQPKYLSSNTSNTSSGSSPSKQVVFTDSPPVFVTKPEASTADSDNNVMSSAKRRNLDSGASI